VTHEHEIRDALATYQPEPRHPLDAGTATALAARRRLHHRVASGVGALAVLVALVVGVVALRPGSGSEQTHTGGEAATSAPTTSRPSHRAGEDRAKASARYRARQLLASFTPPAGAVPTGVHPPLTDAPEKPSTPNLIDLHQSWTVPGDAATVVADLKANPPAGMEVGGSGSGSGPNQPTVYSVDYRDSAVDLVSLDGGLEVSVVQAGPGRVALRADALATWLPTRTSDQQVGSREKQVVIVHRSPSGTGTMTRHTATVTRHADLARIVKSIAELKRSLPGARSCPMDNGEQFQLSFSKGAGTPVDATVTVEVGGCGDVTLHLAGKPPLDLQGSPELTALLQQLDP
jgi:hypothetical protein